MSSLDSVDMSEVIFQKSLKFVCDPHRSEFYATG